MTRKKLLILILIALLPLIFICFDLGRFVTLEELKVNRDRFESFYAAHRILTIEAFMALYVIQTALSLPGAALLSLAAGALFGAILGTICCDIAATLGAMLAFLGARYLFHDAVQKKFGGRLEKLNRELEAQGLHYLLFLRLVPIIPFFLINLAAGVTRLPLRTFILGTMVGIIPGGFVYCNAGATLATIDSIGKIASPRVIASLTLLGLLALVPVIHGKIRGKTN